MLCAFERRHEDDTGGSVKGWIRAVVILHSCEESRDEGVVEHLASDSGDLGEVFVKNRAAGIESGEPSCQVASQSRGGGGG